MSSLGSYLRDLRQRRGQSVEDVARATRVAARYLDALEADQLSVLPPPVFTRGYIRAYCQVLGETADEALQLYDRETGMTPRPAARVTSSEPGATAPAARGRGTVLVSFVLLVVLGLALFAVTLALQSGREKPETVGATSAPTETAMSPASDTPTPPAETALAPSGAAPLTMPSPPPGTMPRPESTAGQPGTDGTAPRPGTEGTAAKPAPSPSEINAALGGSVAAPYQLVARISEPTWIRVRMEDGRATEETVAAGQTRVWVSNTPFVLTIGNAGGVSLELNGRPLPPLGARGAVIPRLVVPPPGQ